MRLIWLLLVLIFTTNSALTQSKTEVLRFKSKIGFVNSKDKIEKYKFLEDGKKLVLVGKRNLQMWDVENGKLISNISYDLHDFSRAGKLEAIGSLGIRLLVKWSYLEVDPEGKWFAAIEEDKDGAEKVVVRDWQTGNLIRDLDVPGFSAIEFFLIIIKLPSTAKVRKEKNINWLSGRRILFSLWGHF